LSSSNETIPKLLIYPHLLFTRASNFWFGEIRGTGISQSGQNWGVKSQIFSLKTYIPRNSLVLTYEFEEYQPAFSDGSRLCGSGENSVFQSRLAQIWPRTLEPLVYYQNGRLPSNATCGLQELYQTWNSLHKSCIYESLTYKYAALVRYDVLW
jgi:hypothetical protein